MGGLSLPHLIIVALVVLVLFGRGRISDMMGDFGKGIKSFKEGMSEETNRPATPPPSQIPPASQVPPAPVAPVQPLAPVIPADTTGPVGGA
ncbi:Sec-independent protein translocase subunit TatA [Novosphingobium sp.]|uniref:Sec-independent protein translocase subunit TatA n=1 Tax=Novosphingobium sp. TaxID=1874826 RepID=UPI003D1044A6